jgi:hypothetical protein
MGRPRRYAPDALLALLLQALTGCGGGSSSILPPPPAPPQPDFSLGFSQNSINLQQGATSSSVSLSVNALNGFTGSVQVSLTGLPAGVLSNPQGPFSVAAGASTPIFFSAAANAPTGNFTLTAAGTSGFRIRQASRSPFKVEYSPTCREPPMREQTPSPQWMIRPASRTTATSHTIPPTS